MTVSFIVGSPRSGTTILGNILGSHRDIAEFYEPYYLWGKYFPCKEDDVWSERFLTDRTVRVIRREFDIFQKKSKKPFVLVKLPAFAINIGILRKIFPEAKWVHIVRDGRDVTLSIKKEYDKRRRIVEEKDYKKAVRLACEMLGRQPFWRYKVMAVWYELTKNASLNPAKYLTKAKWGGKVGWGPRLEDWKEFLRSHSLLEYQAMQWTKSVEALSHEWPLLPARNSIEIRYEHFLREPERSIKEILSLLGLSLYGELLDSIPHIKKDNYNKWKNEFSRQEIEMIMPILRPMLERFGYL